jgi:hypothetical protein
MPLSRPEKEKEMKQNNNKMTNYLFHVFSRPVTPCHHVSAGSLKQGTK